MADITLYCFPQSTCSQKVRLALWEKGIQFEERHVNHKEREHLSDWYLKLNPNGVVPTLTDGDDVIIDSSVILEYLEETTPSPCLLPGGPAERAEARRLMDWFDRKYDGEVNAYLLHEKLEKRVQALGAPDPAALRAGREHLRWHLDHMAWLLETRDGLAGPRYTLADIAAAAHLSCADYLGDVPWDEFEPVKHWYQRVKCRPAFRGLLADKLPGMPPAGHYADLDF